MPPAVVGAAHSSRFLLLRRIVVMTRALSGSKPGSIPRGAPWASEKMTVFSWGGGGLELDNEYNAGPKPKAGPIASGKAASTITTAAAIATRRPRPALQPTSTYDCA